MSRRRRTLLALACALPLLAWSAPRVWAATTPALALPDLPWRVTWFALEDGDCWTFDTATYNHDPWDRPYTFRDGEASLVRDAWAPELYRREGRGPARPYARLYSLGPDGLDQQGEGDDVLALHPRDPKRLLYQLARDLGGVAALGLALGLLLLLERRALGLARKPPSGGGPSISP